VETPFTVTPCGRDRGSTTGVEGFPNAGPGDSLRSNTKFLSRMPRRVCESPLRKTAHVAVKTVGAVVAAAPPAAPNSRSTLVSLAACESSIKTFGCPEGTQLFRVSLPTRPEPRDRVFVTPKDEAPGS
jgi:hypothetical protein